MFPNYEDFLAAFTSFAEAVKKPFSWTNITYPHISILNGKRSTNAIIKLFKDQRIEDLWQLFFAVSCNLNQANQSIFQEGLLWRGIRASCAIPGLMPPLAENGNLYVDGSVINNLPVDVMRDCFDGMGKIIAVDLSATKTGYGNYSFPPIITLWDSVLMEMRIGKQKNYVFPEFYDTLLQSLLVGSAKKNLDNCLLADLTVKPDLSNYRLMQSDTTHNSSELISIGYQSMLEKIALWKR